MDTFRNQPRRTQRMSLDGVSPVRAHARKPSLDRGRLVAPKPASTMSPPSRPMSPPRIRPKPEAPDMSVFAMTLDDEATNDAKTNRTQGRKTSRFNLFKNRKRKPHGLRRRILIGGLAVVTLMVLGGGVLFAQGMFTARKVFKGGGKAVALAPKVDPSLLKGEGDGRVNFLLLGRGGEGHDGADLTDTILLASIDPVNKKAALVSLPRDFWVSTPYGSSKVNAVFAYAKQRGLAKGEPVAQAEADGINSLESVVQGVFGVPIHYYGIVDFSAFEQAVNAVSGVDINVTPATAVTEHMWDESTQRNYYLNVQPGMQHFDGQKALFYTRSRHTSARGDFDRTERQRIFIEALVQKIASSQTYTNPVKISELLSTIGKHISTDVSLSDATRLMTIGKSIGGSFDSVDLAAAPNPLVQTSMVSGQSVVVPTTGVGNYGAIQALIRSRLPDGYIVNENAPITVLNGSSDPTAATKKAEELRAYGYNVGTVADAPAKTYQHTVLVDLSKGKKPYTKNYLQKRFGVTATTTLPDTHIQPGNASFVIIVGQQ